MSEYQNFDKLAHKQANQEGFFYTNRLQEKEIDAVQEIQKTFEGGKPSVVQKQKSNFNQNVNNQFKLEEFLALWINKSAKGEEYLSGKLPNGKGVIGFFVRKKKNVRQPDLRLFIKDK